MPSLRDNAGEVLFWAVLVAVWLAGGWVFYGWILEPGVSTLSFELAGRTYEILEPLFFGGLLLLPVLWIVQRWTLSDLPRYQRWLNVTLRALVVAAIVGALVQVVVTSFESRITTVFVVDTSASVPDEGLSAAADVVQRARDAKGPDDRVRVVGFARRPYEIDLPDDELETIPRPDDERSRRYTDIASALRKTYGLFPPNHLKRVVVVSDGNETRGDFLSEIQRAAEYGVRVHHAEVDYPDPPEVLIRGVEAPETLEVDAPFHLTAKIHTNRAMKASLTLWQSDFKGGSKTVELEEGVNDVSFEVEVIEPGFRRFELEMEPEGPDTIEANNEYVYSAEVEGKPRVLYVEGERRSRHYLQKSLQNENFEVEARGPGGLPTTLEDFDQFDAVILSDVAATEVSRRQMKLIDRYVRELGGGFINVGGENSFGPGGYHDTALEELLPVTFQPKARRKRPNLALMLVVDKSGSMSGERIELAKEAAKATVEMLGEDDKVGVAAFDDTVQQLVRMQSASNRVRIQENISRLQAGGGTDIASGLSFGYEKISFTRAKLKHIILLSDGHSEASNIFSEVLPSMRVDNVTVSTVGIGAEAATTLLRRVAEGGGGRYYFTSDPYNIPQIFMKETSTVSRDSMVEQPFRPRVAKEARVLREIPWDQAPYLLGYVATRPKDGAEVLLTSDRGDPILARWRQGLGKVAAFTSDLKNRWAVQWVQWSGYGTFWSQLIRDTMRTDDETRLAMRATVEQNEAHVVVDAIDRNDDFINGLDSQLVATTPNGDKQTYTFDQTAPGRYEIRMPLEAYGSYQLKAQHRAGHATDASDFSAVSYGTVSYPYPREHLFTEPNRQKLRRAAEATGGTNDPEPAQLFDAEGESVKYRRELWPWFLVAAGVLLLLDLASRRIRMGGETEVSWDELVRRS